MGLVSLLFSFNGRINRLQYWLGCVLVILAGGALCALGFLIAAPSLPNPKLMAQGAGLAASDAARAVLSMGLAILIAAIFLLWTSLALQVKRFHDRGRTGYLSLLPLALSAPIGVIGGSVAASGDPASLMAAGAMAQPFAAIIWIINLWFFVELGFLPSKSGPNRYGDAPGAPPSSPSPVRDVPPSAAMGAPVLAGAQAAMERAIAERARQAAPASVPARATAVAPSGGFGRRPAR